MLDVLFFHFEPQGDRFPNVCPGFLPGLALRPAAKKGGAADGEALLGLNEDDTVTHHFVTGYAASAFEATGWT